MQTLEHHEISGKQEKGRGRVNTRVGEKRQPKNESKGDSIPQTKNQMKMAPKILKNNKFFTWCHLCRGNSAKESSSCTISISTCTVSCFKISKITLYSGLENLEFKKHNLKVKISF